MTRRRVSNPLALAVLGLLCEKPMHPYEMSTTLRERAKEDSIKLNYGSLYSVVESLQRHSLITAQETVREGRRPERTVYAITETGRAEFVDWLSELISVPVKEFTQFEAALSLMAGLPPDDVVKLLQMRSTRLSIEITGLASVLDKMSGSWLPDLFVVESRYRLALRKAEADFVDELTASIRDGTLDGVQLWREVYETGEMPSEADWHRAGVRLRSVT